MGPLRYLFILTLLCAAFGVQPCRADLKVERVLWGVDDRLREERFNLITYELFNNSEVPWEGDLSLQPKLGLSPVDVPQVQRDVFIEPYGRRYVQFVVFIPTVNNFELKWGRRLEERFEPESEPETAKTEAIIQLVDIDSPALKTASVATLDESLFPTSVAGFDGVHAILLDHVPRWDDVRIRTLKDWVYRGGRLHLFQQSSGKYPDFPAALAGFNEPSDAFGFGSGRIVRHPMNVSQAKREYIAENIAPPEPPEGQQQTASYLQWFLPSKLLASLREMTQPEHEWWLIYTMAAVYLAAIFPGCYFIAKKKGDFRLTYLSLLVVVGLFSMGFRAVGARGYGEETMINSVAIARPVSDGRVEVTQWSNFFVTGGGQFAVQHKAEGLVYGTGQAVEDVRGFAQNRPVGLLAVDIPSFSGRSIVHTGVLKAPFPKLSFARFGSEPGTTGEMRLNFNEPGRWSDINIKSAYAVIGNELYQLVLTKDGLVTGGFRQPLGNAINESNWTSYGYRWDQTNKPGPDQIFEIVRQMLIAYDLGLRNQEQLSQFSLPPGRMRVYIYSEMPQEFQANITISALQRGCVLYVDEFPIPDPNGGE